jgi:ribosomal protein S18 acetylase RimI-like enzyme
MNTVSLHTSPPVSDEALNELFSAVWSAHVRRSFRTVLSRSLLYVCAYKHETLVGFVNVAWDGGQHAFILDTCVHSEHCHQGIGKALVRKAVEDASQRGVTWLHVDYEPQFLSFYQACGFRQSNAGVLRVGA